ncbi:tRNA(Ile)-lysidine synthetase [Flavobacteriaceae bacterium 3519-10]|nr:tRNA(Ile)-lysidine synthetase [Flavobacteriaceae bacterium 3519-10]
MLTQATFDAQLLNLKPDPESARYLLAVSGGVDSMVLLYLFSHSNLEFEVAHVNYRLRGVDSDADQRIVEEFCAKHHLTLHVYEVGDHDGKPANSVQLWARELRYGFFRKIQIQSDLQYIVTAHHLNDQLETFIINLSRASGLNGLSGIPSNENGILRPLLNFTKNDIYDFAAQRSIQFGEDVSNSKNDYLRNFIRNEIAHRLLETNTGFLPNFSRTIHYLDQAKDFIHEQISAVEDEIISHSDDSILIDREKFGQQSDFVKFEILRKLGFDSATEVQKIVAAEKGKCFKSADYILTVDRNHLILNAIDSQEFEPKKIIITSDALKNPASISLRTFLPAEILPQPDFSWEFDADQLQFPLKLRHRLAGDVFFPVGMAGSKKVAKFFKDEKIPIFAQRKMWLMCDGDDNILGVIPIRQDRRFAADHNAKNIISVHF